VTTKRTQYAAAEDSEFYTEIDVQQATDGFVLAVVRARDDRTNEFYQRVLHRYIPEVWLVDVDACRMITSRRDHEPVVVTDVVVSVQMPRVRIVLAEIF